MLGIVSRRRQARLVLGQVGAAGGHLAGARTIARARLAASRRPRARRGRGRRAGRRARRERAARALAAPAPDEPALDRGGALGLDQLLGDRPGERLERLGPPPRPQPRLAPDHRADQRVAPERAVELRQVVVGPSAKRMRSMAAVGAASRVRLGPEPHAPAAAQARTIAGLSPRWMSRTSAPSRRRTTPSRPARGMPVRPVGRDVALDDDRARLAALSMCTSTRNEREAAISERRPRLLASPSAATAPRAGAAAPAPADSRRPRAGTRRWPRPPAAGSGDGRRARAARGSEHRAGAGPRLARARGPEWRSWLRHRASVPAP